MAIDFEFYETPQTFTRYLFREMMGIAPIVGTVFEPCVGSGAIVRAAQALPAAPDRQWVTNDLDPRWPADYHEDAANTQLWNRQGLDAIGGIDWTVSNPPFTPAIDIVTRALSYSRIGVALHLRASIHEVLKTGPRRWWMAQHTPTGILWLPRFAYQRSKKTGDWTTDSVCACWVIWLQDRTVPQFICYAPEWVLDELAAETPTYRARMDALMAERQELLV